MAGYLAIGTPGPGGFDIYEVKFEHGSLDSRVLLDAAGRLPESRGVRSHRASVVPCLATAEIAEAMD